MALYQNYPYTDLQTLNLDGVLQQVKTNKENIETNTTDISAETAAREQADQQEAAARAAADANLQEQINILSPINVLNYVTADKKSLAGTVLFVGDSYLAGWTPDGDVTDWGTLLAGMLGKTLNENAFRLVLGGAGFVNAIGGRTFVSLLQDAAADESINNADVKYIITAGGWNDRGASDSALNTAVDTYHSTAATLFPNAISYVANVGYGRDYNIYQKAKVSRYYNKYNGLGDIFTVLAVNHQIDDGCLASDNIHPNAYGESLLATAIYQAIFCGDYYGDNYGPSQLTTSTGIIANAIVSKHALHVNMFRNAAGQFIPNSLTSGIANGNTVALELTSNLFYAGGTYWETVCPCAFQCSTSPAYRIGFMKVRLYQNKVQLMPLLFNANGTDWQVFSGIVNFVLAGFSIDVPMNRL